MKRLLMIAALSLFTSSASAAELHVYAGAGLREAVDKLVETYGQQTGNKVMVEYGGSGQLLARITETGKGDLFIPGSMIYVDQLDKDGQILSKAPLAVHGAVVAVNKAAAEKVKEFADLAKPGLRIGLGDPQAMALGRTAEMILERSGQKEAILANVVTRAATVKQLGLYVVNGEVDVAIVGGPEVAKNAASVVAVAIPKGLYEPEIAGYGVLKTSVDPKAAEGFAALLRSNEGKQAFAQAGFPPVK